MAEIILCPSVSKYFGNITNLEGRNLERILTNPNNIFKINKMILDTFEKQISSKNIERWKDWFTQASDSHKIISSNTNTLDIDSIFLENPKELTFLVPLINKKKISNENKCSLEDSCNINKLLLKLLSSSEIIFDSNNFTDNNEIELFFNLLINFSKLKINNIVILSRHIHPDSKLIEILNKNFINKIFCTTLKKGMPIHVTNDLKYLRKNLGPKLKVYTCKVENLHERRIVIGDLIMTFDHDFNQILINNTTWQCTCKISTNFKESIYKKISKFKQLNV